MHILYIILHALSIALMLKAFEMLFIIYPPFIWVREKLLSRLPQFLRTILYECVFCMTAFYGTLFILLFYATLPIGWVDAKEFILIYLLSIGILTQLK